MTNSPGSKYLTSTILIIVGILAVFGAAAAFAFMVSPSNLEQTPNVIPTTSIPSRQYQPEIIPLPTATPTLAQAVTIVPTDTRLPTFTPTLIPTSVFIDGPLPDLIVSGMSDPICVPDRIGTILAFTIFVRNIGRVRTRSFGSFDVGVSLLIGPQKYSLEEWGTKFDGVVGSSNLEVFNLNPDQDIKFTVVIDLKGNKRLGVEVTANSGENPIPEADMTNNTLIKYFSVYCY